MSTTDRRCPECGSEDVEPVDGEFAMCCDCGAELRHEAFEPKEDKS